MVAQLHTRRAKASQNARNAQGADGARLCCVYAQSTQRERKEAWRGHSVHIAPLRAAAGARETHTHLRALCAGIVRTPP